MTDPTAEELAAYVPLGYALADLFEVAANRPDGVHLVVQRGLVEPLLVDNVNCVYVYVPEPTAELTVETIVAALARTRAVPGTSAPDEGFAAFQASRLHALKARDFMHALLVRALAAARPRCACGRLIYDPVELLPELRFYCADGRCHYQLLDDDVD